jgi:hypothetical protein
LHDRDAYWANKKWVNGIHVLWISADPFFTIWSIWQSQQIPVFEHDLYSAAAAVHADFDCAQAHPAASSINRERLC